MLHRWRLDLPSAVDGVNSTHNGLGTNASDEDAWMEALSALDAEIGGGEKSQSPSGFETPSSSSDGRLIHGWMSYFNGHHERVIMGVRLVRGLHGSWLGQMNWPSQAFPSYPRIT